MMGEQPSTLPRIRRPNFTQIPNSILDSIHLFSAEQFKVLIYICRRTFGWNKASRQISITTIQEKTGVSDGCVKTCLKSLATSGFVICRENHNDNGSRAPNTYSLNVAKFPRKTREGGGAGNAPGGVGHQMPQGRAPDAPGVGQEMPPYIGTKEKELKENSSNEEKTLPAYLQDQTPETPPATEQLQEPEDSTPASGPRFESQSTLYDLQLDEEVEVFVKNTYRQHGIRLKDSAMKPMLEQMRRVQEDLGREDFRIGLCRYLDTSDDWLKQNSWPLRRYLKAPTEYLTDTPFPASGAASTLPGATSLPLRPSTHSAAAPARSAPIEEKSSDYLTIVNEWNNLIPELWFECESLPDFALACVKKAARDRDFMAVWAEVLSKCRLMVDHRSDVISGFKWLFSTTKEGPLWQQVYMGKYDWATKAERKSGKNDPVEMALQEALRAEREEREN